MHRATLTVNLPYVSINHLRDVEKTTTLQEDIDRELLRSMKEGDPMKLTGIPARKAHENDAIPKIAPKWLKHDKQVGLSVWRCLRHALESSNILNKYMLSVRC